MGEPVTEEMLATWEREAAWLRHDWYRDVLRLIAEVRRLRALDTRGYNVGFATGRHAGDAAGYARAERDVAAMLTAQANAASYVASTFAEHTSPEARDERNGYRSKAGALVGAAKAIEQGAHRGAAKEGT